MGIARNLEYANAQARVRARIGSMPSASVWRNIADAADLDHLIARMRADGLEYWVTALPRSPDTATIERYLSDRLRDFIMSVIRLLPDRWLALKGWLRQGAELVETPLMTVSLDRVPTQIEDLGSPRAPQLPQQRAFRGKTTRRHAGDGGENGALFDEWVEDFARRCPRLTGRERYVVRRIYNVVTDHLRQIESLREQAALGGAVDINVQWRLRHRLAGDLRSLLGGDPFHAGIIFVYGLLELLQYEKCRALLIAQSRRWDAADVLAEGG